MANFDRRPRGRNNNRRNGRRYSGSRPSQVIKLNDQGHSFNHQRVRFNGNASKLFEKYSKLASEALASGDKILAENYFQHADHFSRIMPKKEDQENIVNGSSVLEVDNVGEASLENSLSKKNDSNIDLEENIL